MRKREGIRCEKEMADGLPAEAVGAFEDRGTSLATFGRTVANEEAGDVACNEVQPQVIKEVSETIVGPAAVVGKEIDEGIKNDEAGVDAVDGFKEAGKIMRERKGTIAGGVGCSCRVMDAGEDFDTREVGPEGGEQSELDGCSIDIGCDEYNATLER